jgi:hypothetical protein
MAYQTTLTITDPDEAFVSASAKTVISATETIGINTHRSQTVGYVNAIGNLTAPRPVGFGKIEWTADGQPTNAEPYDTVIRIDEVV